MAKSTSPFQYQNWKKTALNFQSLSKPILSFFRKSWLHINQQQKHCKDSFLLYDGQGVRLITFLRNKFNEVMLEIKSIMNYFVPFAFRYKELVQPGTALTLSKKSMFMVWEILKLNGHLVS